MRVESNWMMDVVSLGRFLRDRREESDLSVKWVSDYLGLSEVSVYHYEIGQFAPSTKILIALCDLYEIDLNVLTQFVHRRPRKKQSLK